MGKLKDEGYLLFVKLLLTHGYPANTHSNLYILKCINLNEDFIIMRVLSSFANDNSSAS